MHTSGHSGLTPSRGRSVALPRQGSLNEVQTLSKLRRCYRFLGPDCTLGRNVSPSSVWPVALAFALGATSTTLNVSSGKWVQSQAILPQTVHSSPGAAGTHRLKRAGSQQQARPRGPLTVPGAGIPSLGPCAPCRDSAAESAPGRPGLRRRRLAVSGRRLRRSGRRGRCLRWPSPRPRPFPVPSVRRRSSELSSPPPGRMHVMPFGARAPPQPRTLRSFTPVGVLPPPPCKVTLTASMRSGGHRSALHPP